MKVTATGLAVSAAIVLNLSGCKPFEDWVAGQIATATEKNINQLREQLKELEKSNRDLEEKIHNLAADIQANERWHAAFRQMYREESASLSSDCQTYGIARTELGPVIVTCDSVVPYLDGFKITLLATVLVPVEVVGLKVKVAWMETDEKFQEKGQGRLRQKEVDSLSSFFPGRYSAIEVPLVPATAAGIKALTISAKTSQVSIAKPSAGRKQ